MSASSPSPDPLSVPTPPPDSSANAGPPDSPTPPPLLPPPPTDSSPPTSASPPTSVSVSPPVPATSPPPPVDAPPPSTPASPPVDSPTVPATPPTTGTSPPSSPPPTTPASPSTPASPPTPVSAPPPKTPNPPSATPPSSSSSSPPPVPPSSSPPVPPSSSPPVPPSSSPPESPSSSPPEPPSSSPPVPPSASPPLSPSSSPPPPQSASPPSSQATPPSPNQPTPSPPDATNPPSSHSPPPDQQPSGRPPTQITSPPLSTQLSPPVSHLSPPPPPGTPSLGTPPSDNSTDSSGTSRGNRAIPAGTIAGVVAGVVLLGLIGIIIWCMVKRKRKRRGFHDKNGFLRAYSHGSLPQPDIGLIIKTEPSHPYASSGSDSSAFKESSHGLLGYSRTGFTYQELFEATNGFASDNFLGEGGFGSVFKGVLSNGREIAVKQLKIGGGQGEREFMAEVDTISRIHHRHLVSLVGYCIFESRRLLVYEYMPNQTLHFHLHEENRPVLDWATRIKIALGAARGIAYLHEDCHPRIIHRDIKSSNILLDAKLEARVSDFGLAKLALDVDTHISTRVMGTFGYMAPEYATSGKLTDKSDVYSYGVVLLELITGRRPVDESQPVGEESLVEWARPLLGPSLDTGRAEGLVDPRLEKNYVENELFLMIEAAAACVRHSGSKRPRMRQVVRAFEGLSPADLSNGMRVGESKVYNPAQQSEQMRWLQRIAFGNEGFTTGFFSDESRSTAPSNPNPGGPSGDPGSEFAAQQDRNLPSEQQPVAQHIYLSSRRTHTPLFPEQSSTPDSSGQSSSLNPNSSEHSSRNMDASSRESRNMEGQNRDTSSRESQSG